MDKISFVPGRIRFKSSYLYQKDISQFISYYTDNLYGVNKTHVNHSTGTILIFYDDKKTNYSLIKNNIESAIYSSKKNNFDKLNIYNSYNQSVKKRNKAKRKFLTYGFLYILFKIKQSLFGKFPVSGSLRLFKIASGITVIAGYPVIKNAYSEMTKTIPTDSDFLLRVVAFCLVLLREDSLGLSILSLKYLNDYINFSTNVKSQKLLNQSMSKNPGMAWVLDSENQQILVPIESLNIQDIICIHEGEVSSIEGIVTCGKAVISSLYHTGHPVITNVCTGNRIYEGSIILSGFLNVKVTKVPKITHKPDIPIENLSIYKQVNKFQKRSTIASLGLGTINYLVTKNILNSLSLILLMCPTASETALNSGINTYMSLLNKNNIYLKNPNTFENIVNTNHIIFDKTGTLTYSNMKIKSVTSFNKRYSIYNLLKICAACEVDHYHPISISLNQKSYIDYDISKVQSSVLLPSKGISAVYDNKKVLIGNKHLMKENNICINKYLEMYTNYENNLYTPIFVSIKNKIAGIIVLEDILREDSYQIIQSLKHKGFEKISLLTGDNYNKAYDTASKLGITNVYSNCNFKDKSNIILDNKEDTIMIIGDGINDVLAMKNSDVSVSFSKSSSDKVKLHSDCIILEDNIDKLSDFISLSKESYKKINQNIAFSKIYNITFSTLCFFTPFNPFVAKSVNTINSLIMLILNNRIYYTKPKS